MGFKRQEICSNFRPTGVSLPQPGGLLEIPGNFVLKRLSSDHNLPVDLFPRRQPLIEVG